MTPFKCPVCKGEDVREVYAPQITSGKDISFSYTFSPEHNRTLGVYGCRTCSHKFCHPIPADIGVNYKNVVDEEYLKHRQSRQLASRKLLRTLKAHQPIGKLVDIGCATGDFLVEATAGGYESEGIEPCAWSAELARQRGLVVHEELLEHVAERRPREYDIATLWGVIEHFADPAAEVARIARILRPGGILALWTGDVDSVTSRALGRKWWYWQGQHIQYFTHRSLTHLLWQAGFEVADSKLFPFAATYDTISNSLTRYRSHRVLTALVRPMFALSPIWYLYLPGEMFIVARKVPH